MSHLFDVLNSGGFAEFTVHVSLIEIYNEEIFDLLSTSSGIEKLKMYDDANYKGAVKIKGVDEVAVKNKDEIYQLMERGTLKRKVAATQMNAHFSRSHCVFQIQINMKVKSEDKNGIGKVKNTFLKNSELSFRLSYFSRIFNLEFPYRIHVLGAKI